MTVEEFIWDIFEIKNQIEDDSDLEEMWVLHKLNLYRAAHIEAEYALTNEINPQWLQRVFKYNWEKTTAADDPSITFSSITLGKAILPSVVKLPENLGIYRISGSGGINTYDPVSFDRLLLKAQLEKTNIGYGFYAPIGNTVYIWPYAMQGSAVIIATNPMDVQVNDQGTLRAMTFQDEYPIDPVIAQRVILDFLQKDMALKDGTITDIINDSQDKLKILKDAGLISSNKA